ncbi:6036_t:CDS:2, partial [Paraglomus occultum]
MTDKRFDADKMIETSSSADETAIRGEEIDEFIYSDDDQMNGGAQRNGDYGSADGAQPNEERMVADEYAEDVGGPQMRGKLDEQSGDGNEHINLVYEVEAVVGHRLKKPIAIYAGVSSKNCSKEKMWEGGGRIQYLIKWKGYPTEQNTWEYRDNVYCESLLGKYWDSKEELVKQDPTRQQPTKSPPAKSKKSAKNQSSRKSDKRKNSRNIRSKEESDEDEIFESKPKSKSTSRSSKQSSKDKNNTEYDDGTNDSRRLKKRRVDTSGSKTKSNPIDDNQMMIEQSSPEPDDEEFCPAEIAGSWEPHIKEVQTVQMAEDGQLMVYLNWINGHTTAHSAKLVNAKCPQK